MKTFLKAFVMLLVLLLPLPGQAWNALGHMVVASIAYQHLNPTVRNQVDRLTSDFKAIYPEIQTFSALAPWPDQLHLQHVEAYSRWHYIDNPFSDDGTPLINTIDTDNAVWAVNTIKQVVKNNRANVYERARFLAFFIHIVGDLHQPLHTVSRLSAAYPTGDKGGNSFFVRYEGGRENLHHVWDVGLGQFDHTPSKELADTIAVKIAERYPSTYFAGRQDDLNPAHWAGEGVQNAKQYVYATKEDASLSSSYLSTGTDLVQREAALAGYRLATLLNQLFASTAAN